MTEDEAKEKWCPFVNLTTFRDSDGYDNIYDNRGNNDGKYRCIGSMCMAWVWDDVIEEVGSAARIVHQNASSTSGNCGMVK